MTPPTPADQARVQELLGREPQGEYEIVVRDETGDPVVLKNSPLMNDGTPMPTRFWLVGPAEIRRIGQLEASGGVDQAEAEVHPDELTFAHQRYAAERDAAIPDDHQGPRPSGGVGGTRQGVKCLHAHWAWHLAGGNDPIGRWVETRLTPNRIDIAATTTIVQLGSSYRFTIPWGNENLTQRWLANSDPPRPEELLNALGSVDDFLDDIERGYPELETVTQLTVGGAAANALARLELGVDQSPPLVTITRANLEEVFRLVSAETTIERHDNPGLPAAHTRTIIATMCIVLAFARRLRLTQIRFDSNATAD